MFSVLIVVVPSSYCLVALLNYASFVLILSVDLSCCCVFCSVCGLFRFVAGCFLFVG